MKIRKIKHWNRGYDIVIKVGNRQYCSWWSSPPKENLICHLEYLRNRYLIITTEKRVQEFKRLWVEMWDKEDKPKARKIIEDFIKESGYTWSVESILEGYIKSKKYYVSYTMGICIKNLEPQIKTLLDLWEV